MKIIYIANARIPTEKAHGLQIMQMCQVFAENNCAVELIVPRRVNSIKQDPFSYYGVQKIFSCVRLPCLDFIFANESSFFFWLQTITFLLSAGFFLVIRPLLACSGCVFKKYDILYTREQMVGLFFSGHTLEVHSLPKKVRRAHLFLWKRAGRFVVLTSFIKKGLVEHGIDPDKIIISPDGVDPAKFDISISKKEARQKLGLPENIFLVGYVGMLRTLGMEKGIDTVIQAIGRTENREAKLVLVGGSPEDIDFYKRLAVTFEVSDRVFFIGRVSHTLIPIYLKAFDALVAPFPENEHYKYYMSPMKIFEYMASGRPIISTRLPSILEVMGNGEALLVSPGNVTELAQGIDKVLSDQDFATALSDKALTAVSNYTWDERVKKILQFIKISSKNK